ncbi:hypothetical protein K4K51_007347 [Colletotrichum sp. SAR 10_75]|nr:hypothetical protein K4K51_007347 [Colletotrichum sp. SAR 10_75]
MGLRAHFRGISNANYTIDQEILKLVVPSDVSDMLPKALATTKNAVTKRLPLLDMRVMDVPLKIEKLHTLSET